MHPTSHPISIITCLPNCLETNLAPLVAGVDVVLSRSTVNIYIYIYDLRFSRLILQNPRYKYIGIAPTSKPHIFVFAREHEPVPRS